MNLGIVIRSIVLRKPIVTSTLQRSHFHCTSFLQTPRGRPVVTNAFGLDEGKDMNDLLVQGHFRNEKAEVEKTPPEKQTVPVNNEEMDTDSRLKKYDGWLQYRKKERIGNVDEIETTRLSRYGSVRLDKENIAEDPKGKPSSKSGNMTSRTYTEQMKELMEDDMDPGENKPMTAHEFLRKHKLEQENVIKTAVSHNKKIVTYEKRDGDEYATPTENSAAYEYLDSNVLPKQYQMKDLNTLTRGDMWSLLKSSVIFENEYVLAINKPYGIPFKNPSRDCRHSVVEFLKELAIHTKCPEVFPLHRLDKDTTGAMMFAKDKRVAKVISDKFANRQIQKLYLTITKNSPQMLSGTIKIPIGEGKVADTRRYRSILKPDLNQYNISSKQRDSKEAITKFKVIRSYRDYAFLEIRPETGLKHQIRVHLGLGLGCPVFGDHKYSHRDRFAPQRLSPYILHKLKVKQSKVRDLPLHLHCCQIAFDLSSEFTSSTEPVFIHAKVPNFFNHTLKVLYLTRK